MDLPLIGHIREKGKEEPEYFLALEITNSRVKSAVWVVVNNQTEVITTGTVVYWQGKDVEELVRATDDSLASLAQKLSDITDKEPSKVVLGLPATWVGEDNKIVGKRILYLKELTKRLELSLIGFVVTTEALIQSFKGQEGVPLSAILVEMAEEEIEVTLVHLGKVLGRQKVARSIDLGADLEEGLTRFLPQAIFPSRMILFDGHASLEEARQQLLDHPWQAKGSKLPFLHLPKVEILLEEETVKAVALSGGAEAAKAIGFAIATSAEPGGPEESEEDEEDLTEEAGVEEVTGEQIGDRSDDLGFVRMGDVRQLKPEVEEVLIADRMKREQGGVMAGTENEKETPLGPVKRLGQSLGPSIVRLMGWVNKLRFGKLALIAVVPLVLVVVAGLGWWFLARAKVTVEVQSKTLEKKVVLVLDPSTTSVDLARNVIPVQAFSGQASGQKSIGATGQKTVGIKARGTVVIYNTSGTAEVLGAGTLLTSGSGLKFSLDEAVTAASASGTADNNLTSGQATVVVSAADVGSEYNLAGGTVFSVPGFTQVQMVAKNTDAFTGGDKREVQAVDKNDLAMLSGQLTDELTPKAKDGLMTKIPADFLIIDGSLSFKSQDGAFDKVAGDEATTVTLTESVVADALAMPKSGKQALVSSLAKDAFPQGYEVDQTNSSIDFGKLKVGAGQGGGAKVEATVKLLAIPFINRGKLASDIAGKDMVKADAILAKVPGFIREEIRISPSFFSYLPLLPVKAGDILITLNTR